MAENKTDFLTQKTELINKALYEKMSEAQKKYREWLLQQTPEEILNHACEYTVREDILMSMEYHDLDYAEAKALHRLPDPLDAMYKDLNKRDDSRMDDIADVIDERAKKETARQSQKKSEPER